jgi:hypothetical protein
MMSVIVYAYIHIFLSFLSFCISTESSIDSLIGKEYEPPNAAMTIYTCNSEERFSKIHESK